MIKKRLHRGYAYDVGAVFTAEHRKNSKPEL